MKLIEALRIVHQVSPEGAPRWKGVLACGFTPLHLQTFLAAHLRLRLPDRQVEVETGLYGDLAASLERRIGSASEGCAVVLEWADLDRRLGLRLLGGWRPRDLADILQSCCSQAERMRQALEALSESMPVAFCLPTLPLPPLSFAPGLQASSFELELRQMLNGFSVRLAKIRGLSVASSQRLEQLSPAAGRWDLKSELLSDFPYTVAHASAMAELLAQLLTPPPPKKGLITDLDDTLWSGILGEDGVEKLSWDLDHRTQMHGVYQQFLMSLSEAGVLIGGASKNDPQEVKRAFTREDLVLRAECIFPVEAQWGPKSQSVDRILKTWNIGADSVVFVDDSLMEMAEVKAAHPDIECHQFPKGDDPAIFELIVKLRDLFGKGRLSEEDALRMESIRRVATFRQESWEPSQSLERFLAESEAEVTLKSAKESLDPRALELVNKTNQFNLNGRRYTEQEWKESVRQQDAFLWIAAYKDKYGPLGKIAVLKGRLHGKILKVDTWVMSCRAFSRRIEHRCLEELFTQHGAEEIIFDLVPTPKNGPLREFFAAFAGELPKAQFGISRNLYLEKRPTVLPRNHAQVAG